MTNKTEAIQPILDKLSAFRVEMETIDWSVDEFLVFGQFDVRTLEDRYIVLPDKSCRTIYLLPVPLWCLSFFLREQMPSWFSLTH